MGIMVLTLIAVPKGKEENKSTKEGDKELDESKKLGTEKDINNANNAVIVARQIFLNPTIILLIVNVLFFGIFWGFRAHYFGLYLELELGASQTQMGAAYAIATAGEVCFYPFGLALFFSSFFLILCHSI